MTRPIYITPELAAEYEKAGEPLPPGAIIQEAPPTTNQSVQRFPGSAEVTERDARGNPTVYRWQGKDYYAPGSTPYEIGFRNSDEYRRAQNLGASLGPHAGSKIPDNTVVYLEGEKPVARYTTEKLEKGELELNPEKIRVPVMNYAGKQVLLTSEQIEYLGAAAGNPEEQLKLAKKYNIVSKKTTMKQFAGGIDKEAAAEAFTSQQEQARFERQNTILPDGVYVAKSDLADLKKENPELYKIYTKQGFDAGNKYVEEWNATIESDKSQPATTETAVTVKAQPESVVKNIWRILTPWDEQAGENFIDYAKKEYGFKKFTAEELKKEQEKLKAEYEAEKTMPTWMKILTGGEKSVVYDKKNDLYLRAVHGEAPLTAKAGGVKSAVKVAVKERVNWKAITDAIKAGKAKSAADVAKIAKTSKTAAPAKESQVKKAIELINKAIAKSKKTKTLVGTAKYRTTITPKQRGAIRAARGFDQVALIYQEVAAARTQQAAIKILPVNLFNQQQLNKLRLIATPEKLVQLQTIHEQMLNTSNQTELKQLARQQVKRVEELKQEAERKLKLSPQAAAIISESYLEAIQQATQTQTELKNKLKNIAEQKIKPLESIELKTEVKQKIETFTEQAAKTPARRIPQSKLEPLQQKKTTPAKIPMLSPGAQQSARKRVKAAKGAIAWKMGQLNGKDRWDVIIAPYSNDEHGMIILGAPPEGATIVTRGKGSAKATAQMIRGKKKPSRKVEVDSGITDIDVTPGTGRRINLNFTADPGMETKGDITLGGKGAIITRRPPIITRRPPKISRKVPKIR